MNKLTIKDIAKKAGVSIATVSNVINGTGRVSTETTQKVKRIIEELQYRPSMAARNLKAKNSRMIAVVVPLQKGGRLQDNPFYWELVSGIEAGARNEKFHVLLSGVEENETFAFLKERHIDGCIVVGTYDGSNVVQNVLSTNVPCVFMDSYLSDESLYQVTVDDHLGGYLGTRHLLGLGHTRIAVLTGKLREGSVIYHRLEGYKRALKEAGIPFDPDLVMPVEVSALGGYQAAQKVGDARNDITAVFAFSDIAAMGLLKGLTDIGIRIPQDVSVMGFDDIYNANYLTPALTTVKQNILLRGRKAVELLMDQINGEYVLEKKVVMPVDLKVRQTTAWAGGSVTDR